MKESRGVIAGLMVLFDMGERGIQKLIDKNDIRLTAKDAVEIVQRHTGLGEDEILVESDPVNESANT